MSDRDAHNKVPDANDSNGSVHQDKSRHGWVKFDEETGHKSNPLSEAQGVKDGPAVVATASSITQPPAVLTTETVHVNLERGDRTTEPVTQGTLSKNIEFVNIRHGFSKFLFFPKLITAQIKTYKFQVPTYLMNFFYIFTANGDIIVTLLPVNTKWPWITAAHFRPELVPEELMAQGLTVS